jgi:hypothetical protein
MRRCRLNCRSGASNSTRWTTRHSATSSSPPASTANRRSATAKKRGRCLKRQQASSGKYSGCRFTRGAAAWWDELAANRPGIQMGRHATATCARPERLSNLRGLVRVFSKRGAADQSALVSATLLTAARGLGQPQADVSSGRSRISLVLGSQRRSRFGHLRSRISAPHMRRPENLFALCHQAHQLRINKICFFILPDTFSPSDNVGHGVMLRSAQCSIRS